MANGKHTEAEHCYHCGGPCDSAVIHAHEKSFCCEGCKTVFELLSDNEMSNYYAMEDDAPGIRVESSISERFKYLDNEEVAESLLDFHDAGIARITFYIPKIHCSSCIWLLEHLRRLNPGVIQSQVNFLKKKADVTFDTQKTSLREVVELLARIGYEPALNAGSKQQESKKRIQKSFYYKLGVAGFAFGNIMLLSFPEYLAGEGTLDKQFGRVFGMLNFVLALPVFLYSASEYYVSAWRGLKGKYINIDVPVSLGIIALFGRSAYDILSDSGAGFMDSFAMFVFLLLVGKWYQNYTYQSLSFERDYQSYFPIAVTRIVNKTKEIISLSKLQTGDVLEIKNGELIPADSILCSPRARIDYSFVTGESIPVVKEKGDKLFAGGRQTGGKIEIETTKPVSQSYLTDLWNREELKSEKTPINTLIDRVSKNFTIGVIILGTLSLAAWLYIEPSEALNVFTAVLIVACPCALALTVPFTFGSAMRYLGRAGLFLKNTDAIERMADADTLVFDKTGTITMSKNNYARYSGNPLSSEEKNAVKALAGESSHPLSKAVYASLDGSDQKTEHFKEHTGSGIEGESGGFRIKLGSRKWLNVKEQSDPLAAESYLEIDGEIKGKFILEKQYRPGLSNLVKELKKQYELFIVSGDNEAERERLSSFFTQNEKLYFNQSPEDKLKFIKNLEAKNKQTVMFGDGLNDAGALKTAGVGLAVAEDIHQFSPACDGIMDSAQFSRIGKYLTLSKKAMKVIKYSFIISISYNSIGLLFAVQGYLTPLIAAILMPLSSVTVVAFTTLMMRKYAKKLS